MDRTVERGRRAAREADRRIREGREQSREPVGGGDLVRVQEGHELRIDPAERGVPALRDRARGIQPPDARIGAGDLLGDPLDLAGGTASVVDHDGRDGVMLGA